jgi:dTDP-4-amino-4,6-dideoxygalactose transaminase
MNDFRRQWSDVRADVLAAVEVVGASGWYILGKEVQAFENALSASWGSLQAVGVGSGLDAIEISLRALGCCAGDKVLTTPLSAFATTLAIVKLGATPVFVDCDDFGLIDLEQCREVFRYRPDIRFFVPVHLYGHSLDLAALRALRDEFELAIVEDCAQSIAATFQGELTGSAGQMAATSFYPTKNLGALGDGGAVLTSDAGLFAAARCLRDYGQTGKYQHDELGYNSRLDEIQASVLRRAQLPRLARWTERRRHIAAIYLDGIRHESIHVPGAPSQSASCWHLFPVRVGAGRRADFIKWLSNRGVGSGEHYPHLIPDQRAMKNCAHEVIGDFARARTIAQGEVSLPIHPYLADEEIARVVDSCNRWGG